MKSRQGLPLGLSALLQQQLCDPGSHEELEHRRTEATLKVMNTPVMQIYLDCLFSTRGRIVSEYLELGVICYLNLDHTVTLP